MPRSSSFLVESHDVFCRDGSCEQKARPGVRVALVVRFMFHQALIGAVVASALDDMVFISDIVP